MAVSILRITEITRMVNQNLETGNLKISIYFKFSYVSSFRLLKCKAIFNFCITSLHKTSDANSCNEQYQNLKIKIDFVLTKNSVLMLMDW